MKTIILSITIMVIFFLQPASGQDNQVKSKQPLTEYYALKNALIAGNVSQANSEAVDFVEAVSTDSSIPEATRVALLKDAAGISNAKDIKKQRASFSLLSNRMFDLAKSQSLSTEPIYKAYCPMAKAAWLSDSPAIKNPYYGNAMLTCGSVVETIK